jgi:hypothetical protein
VARGREANFVRAHALSWLSRGEEADAVLAPAGPSTVEATINELEMDGFDVIVNRVGTAANEGCTVSAVRPRQEYSRSDSSVPGADGPVTTLLGKTVYVDIVC